jgi:hypothetical protein
MDLSVKMESRGSRHTELMELYDELDIVTEVKWMRHRWLGHMERMSDDRSTKKLYNNKPEGLRLVERPRKRWLDEVEQDLKQMEVRRWRRQAQNSDKLRSILKETKVLQSFSEKNFENHWSRPTSLLAYLSFCIFL